MPFLLGLLLANAVAVIAAALARPRAYVVSGHDAEAIVAERQRLRRLARIAAAQAVVVTALTAAALVSHLGDVAERQARRGADDQDSGGNYYAVRDAAITTSIASVVPLLCALYVTRARRRLEERPESA